MEFLFDEKLNVNVVDMRSDSLSGRIDNDNKGWYVNTGLFDHGFSLFTDILFENEGEFAKGVRMDFVRRFINVHGSVSFKEAQEIYDSCAKYRCGGTKIKISADCYLIPATPYRGCQGKKVSK